MPALIMALISQLESGDIGSHLEASLTQPLQPNVISILDSQSQG